LVALQGTVDFFGRFIDINVGWPGRVHDARVWASSSISTQLPANTFIDTPAWTETIGGEEFSQFYVLGDAAYPGGPTLAKGFTGSALSTAEDHFNFKLSGARMTVERAFGRLKGRWKILQHKTKTKTVERTLDYIGACCILHNFCEERKMYFKEEWNSVVNAERIRQAELALMAESPAAQGGVLRAALLRHTPCPRGWKRRDYR
jgi:DDE superfamily endonuclease